MRGRVIASGLLAVLPAFGCGALAQTDPQLSQGTVQMPFVTLDDTRLFGETRYGKALLAALAEAQSVLASENREIEARLAERERELTARRATMEAAAFRAEADAFNTEVESYRAEQKTKERTLYQRHEEDRQRFRDVANQILAQIMSERGALAIIAEEAIVLGFREIDITDAAIARMDEVLGDGSALPQPDAKP